MSIEIRLSPEGRLEILTGEDRPAREKGHSLLSRIRDFTAIDLETTGLSPEFDDIIELSAVRYRDGAEVAAFSQLIDPGYPLPDYIEKITGLSTASFVGTPVLADVLPDYLSFLGTDILVGHSVNYDLNFLYDASVDQGFGAVKNDYIDTLRLCRLLHKEWPDHRLDTVVAELGLPGRDVHRAEADARLAAQVYLALVTDPNYSAVTTRPRKPLKASELTAEDGMVNEDSPLFGKVCVFTGTLSSLTRREAMQLVLNLGGLCGDTVTKKTNFLVLGNADYRKGIKDGKSSKQKKAEKLMLEGADLQIIPESAFLDMLTDE